MIIGIGTDLVAIGRISRIIDRFGDRFLARVFTAAERGQAAARTGSSMGAGASMRQVRFYALRFAAKEAGWKALAPPRRRGIGWHDFEVSSTPDGQPKLAFRNQAAAVFAERGGGRIDLSLSDDGGFALAFVVLSAA